MRTTIIICLLLVAVSANAATPFKILFVGDSLTAERHFTTPPLNGYVEQIGANFPALYPAFDFGGYTTGNNTWANKGIVNHGVGGRATQGYPAAPTNGMLYGTNLQDVVLSENANIVFIMFGTNDEYSDDGIDVRVPLATYKANLEYAIDQIRTAKPSTKIVLMSPPPVIDQPAEPINYADNDRTGTYAAAVQQAASEKSVNFIDIYTMFWDLSGHDQDTMNSTYLLDGMHLNQTGQDLIATTVTSLLRGLMPSPSHRYILMGMLDLGAL